MEDRAQWGSLLLGEKYHRSDWYYNHVVWMDPSHNIIQGTAKTQFDGEVASWVDLGAKKQRGSGRSPEGKFAYVELMLA